jgi:hypothetical protein
MDTVSATSIRTVVKSHFVFSQQPQQTSSLPPHLVATTQQRLLPSVAQLAAVSLHTASGRGRRTIAPLSYLQLMYWPQDRAMRPIGNVCTIREK